MLITKVIGTVTIASIIITGFGKAASANETQNIEITADTEIRTSYEFNPHVYSPTIAQEIPQDYWDSFYNLCDALRNGEMTFECSSQEAYDWATDYIVLNNLFPAASCAITNKTADGSANFENGTGKICYTVPVEEFVEKEASFERLIVNILNYNLDTDDTEYERALKLYLYMTDNFEYSHDKDGYEPAVYGTFTSMRGVCIDFSSVYSYLLLQTGIDALTVGCSEYPIDHCWTYAVINGQAYHIDTTWALRTSNPGQEYTTLDYFMMSDAGRNADGCLVRDLTVQLLPQYWASRSSISFAATDGSYNFRYESKFISLDEENKILTYADADNEIHEFCYA